MSAAVPEDPKTVGRSVEEEVGLVDEGGSYSEDDSEGEEFVNRRLDMTNGEGAGSPQAGTAAAAATTVVVHFEETDNTQEIPHPVKHFLVCDKRFDIRRLQFVRLPNPRTGRMLFFGLCPTTAKVSSTGSEQQQEGTDQQGEVYFMEFQRHRPRFCTWALGDTIEPDSPLSLVLPMDPTFFALFLTCKGDCCDKFVDLEMVLQRGGAPFAALPDQAVRRLEAALPRVCDVRVVGEDSSTEMRYYRFSMEKTKEWFGKKLKILEHDDAMKTFALGNQKSPTDTSADNKNDGTPGETTQERQLEVLREKSCRLLLESIPTSLHSELCKSVDVSVDCRHKTAATARHNGGHWDGSRRRGREEEEELVVEKKKNDHKSSSLKKLEKAGPPKGTPSLASFFAKKKTS